MLEVDPPEDKPFLFRFTVNPSMGSWNVAEVVAVELKVNSQYDNRDDAQLLNELEATGLKVGLLINFGSTKVEY